MTSPSGVHSGKWIRMTSRKGKSRDPMCRYYNIFAKSFSDIRSVLGIINDNINIISIKSFNLKKYIYLCVFNNYNIVCTSISDIDRGLRINHECHGNNSII